MRGGAEKDIDEIRSKYSSRWHPLDLKKVLPEPEVFLEKFVLDAYNISVKNTYLCDEPNAEKPKRQRNLVLFSMVSGIGIRHDISLKKISYCRNHA
jgi:hypothetical protein